MIQAILSHGRHYGEVGLVDSNARVEVQFAASHVNWVQGWRTGEVPVMICRRVGIMLPVHISFTSHRSSLGSHFS
jgi:hypothetical protein